MTAKRELLFCTRSVEFRAASDEAENDGRTLEGYAAVFNQDTEINSWEGHFNERIAKGAFKKTIKERKPVLQFDHGRDARTGSVPIGSFSDIREDNDGLFVQARLFDNPVVEPIRQAIEGGAIDGMSFRFRVVRDEWRDNKNKLVKGEEILDLLYTPGERGPLQRTIREVQLSEAGPVVFPAYAGTSVGVRSQENERSAEDMTAEDRAKVADEYKRTMMKDDPEEGDDFEDGERVREWLAAEDEYKRSVTEWLDAETLQGEIRSWLDAETEHLTRSWLEAEAAWQKSVSISNDPDDAASRSTSSDPDDAVRTDTSTRETQDAIPSERGNPAPEKKVIAMTLAELRARLAELEVRQEELGDEYRDAEMPEAEDKEFDSNKAEIELRKASIAKIEKRMEDIGNGRHSEHGNESAAFHNKDNAYRSLEEIQSAAYGRADFLSRAQDQAKYVLERSHLPKQAEERAKEHLTELIEAGVDDSEVARRIVATGNPAYERAFGKALKAGSTNALSLEDHRALEEARAAINIGSDAASGFAVPFQLDPTLVHLGAGYISPLRQLAKVIQLYGKEYQTLTISEIQVYRALEAEIATETAPTLAQEVLRVNKVHGWVPFSMEADEDWAAMRSEIFSLLQEAKDREEANAFLLGTGSAPQPEGLITGATVTVDTAANAGAFTLADIYTLMEALPVEYEGNASFLATKQIYNKIRGLGAAGNANQLWGSADLSVGNSQRLLETPTYRVTGMDSTTAAGKKFLVYGDIRKAFTILDRIGMEIELVPMLFAFATPQGPATFPANLAASVTQPRPTGQRGFYAHWRNNSKVTHPDAVRVLKGKA
jgi:HK97 family phage major capsid protein/HK97 family phage prohead protease